MSCSQFHLPKATATTLLLQMLHSLAAPSLDRAHPTKPDFDEILLSNYSRGKTTNQDDWSHLQQAQQERVLILPSLELSFSQSTTLQGQDYVFILRPLSPSL